MVLEFKLPDIGEGIAEGEIVKWMVSVGDTVAEHQAVVEVMTDKATVEVPSPMAGKITAIRAQEGDVVPVGDVIFVLEESAGAAAEPAPAPAAPPPPAPAPAPTPTAAASTAAGTLAFKLPDIGEGIAEGEVVQWLVEPGATVEEHQPVVEVMTDKATVEIPSPAAGTVTKVHVQAGEVVPIGTVLFDLATDAVVPASVGVTSAASDAPGATANVVTPAPASAPKRSGGKVLAVPSARRVARELNVDLTQVRGSGRNGVIRRADVEAFAASSTAAAPAPSQAPAISVPVTDRQTRKPFRGVRRKIAEAMARSKFTATHFTVVEEVDVTELVAVRARAKEIGARDGIKVTYMPFLMKAAASALFRFPEMNSQLDEATQEIVTYHYVNLGIATDTDQGLIVPVVRDVQAKGMLQIAKELEELAARTREGKVKPDELKGGTFTITNAGNIGGILATPIINFPEVGILGVHRIVKRPGIVETPEGDEIAVRQYMNLSISVDHRLVDGATAVRFLVHMKELLETPGLLAL
ncbi:MAG TPA: biotin/lipoyl-binding protein [Planctomycetes bacterium]|nr:biotin/lipoyl-binding protein [Planctomycetota bacterium]